MKRNDRLTIPHRSQPLALRLGMVANLDSKRVGRKRECVLVL